MLSAGPGVKFGEFRPLKASETARDEGTALANRDGMAVQPYFDRDTSREPMPLSDAAQNTLTAAEGLLRDWVALVRLEATQKIADGALAAALYGTAALLALLAWVGAAVALGLLLTRWLPDDASAAIVAGLHLLIAGGLVAWARRRTSSGGAS
jgi:hypothetical protein